MQRIKGMRTISGSVSAQSLSVSGDGTQRTLKSQNIFQHSAGHEQSDQRKTARKYLQLLFVLKTLLTKMTTASVIAEKKTMK